MINLLNKIKSRIESIEQEMDEVKSYDDYDSDELESLKQERNIIQSIYREILESEIGLHLVINNTGSKMIPLHEVCDSYNDMIQYKKVVKEEFGIEIDCYMVKFTPNEIYEESFNH